MTKRVKKFWYEIANKKLTVTRASLILGITYLSSNILGVIRERLIAARFGASHMTDIFYASFRIPDLIFNLLVLGAVSSAFVPIFIDYLTKKKEEESNFVASNFLNFLLLTTIVFGILLYALAWKLVPLLLPGFFSGGVEADFHTLEVAVKSVRLMLLSPILFAASSVFGGILNSHRRFVAYALAPVVYNMAIILSIVYLAPRFDIPIYGIIYGVLAGAFLHAAIQFFPALSSGFRWWPVLSLRKYDLPKIIKLTVPRMLAMGTQQVNIIVDTIIASFFVGGITVLSFANNIQTVPTVIFGIAIATAVFPVLAEFNSRDNRNDFKESLSESLRRVLFFMVPAAIIFFVLRAQIVRLLYEVGHFSSENVYWTTKSLGYFAIGIAAQGVIPLLLKAFYALKDTKTPFLISIFVMIVNVILSVSLPFIKVLDFGVAGVALAFSIAGFINAFLLLYYLKNKIGNIDKSNRLFSGFTKITLTSLTMGMIIHYLLYFFDRFVNTGEFSGLLLQTTGSFLIGLAFYFAMTMIFKIEEPGKIFKSFKRS